MKNNFWTFSDEQKSMFVAQTSERVGLPPQAVEKDWWVTMTLKALFESSCRDFITFKGGTSLSKGWHVIERFSEDIDIAIDKSFWRIAGDNKSQRDRIRKLSRAYIEQRLVAEMQALLEGYGASDFELRAVPAQDSDADPTLVLLPYRSIYANIEYVESQIRIEFSCRSMKEPRERIEIRPLIAEAYPDVFGELVFPIYAVVPTRTFLEKAFLLHEEFQKANDTSSIRFGAADGYGFRKGSLGRSENVCRDCQASQHIQYDSRSRLSDAPSEPDRFYSARKIGGGMAQGL